MRNISEVDFANQLIQMVLPAGGGAGPDGGRDWRTYLEESPTPARVVPLVGNTGDCGIVRRAHVYPPRWGNFCRQYYSPGADLLDRMFRMCDCPTTLTWEGEFVRERNPFHMTGHRHTRTLQNATYERILEELSGRGLLRRPASRRYEDDRDAASVRIADDAWIDVPGSYSRLDRAYTELISGAQVKSSKDFPRVDCLYGRRQPILFMVAVPDTRQPRDPRFAARLERVRAIIELNSGSVVRHSVAYVIAERTDGKYVPRQLGFVDAYLDADTRSLVGTTLGQLCFFVPCHDLDTDEEQVLGSRDNWLSHQRSLLEPHIWCD